MLCLACSRPAYRLGQDVTIPFDVANNNVYVRVSVERSAPLWFILDTGDKYALVDVATAQSLGLELTDAAGVHGASGTRVPARRVPNARFSIVGFEGFSQPLFLALPLDELATATGHDVAGILGYDFLSQFVVEIDYVAHTITLHDTARFQYHGTGESIPITFDAFEHPCASGTLTLEGRAPIDGAFVLDIGMSDAVTLHSPFVDREHLLPPVSTRIARPGGHGVGGPVGTTAFGRIEALTLGHFTIGHPVVGYSQATDGPFASANAAGTIGADILRRFNVILDYGHSRVILEPNATLTEPLEYSMSGLLLSGRGRDHRTLTVDSVFEHTPASDAGIRGGDVLAAVDGRAAAMYTLSDIRQLFKQEGPHGLVIVRGAVRLDVTLTLRRLI
jgi:Aspartyl protease